MRVSSGKSSQSRLFDRYQLPPERFPIRREEAHPAGREGLSMGLLLASLDGFSLTGPISGEKR
jgi:hypothetical protein